MMTPRKTKKIKNPARLLDLLDLFIYLHISGFPPFRQKKGERMGTEGGT
jgi:hypothetical protein